MSSESAVVEEGKVTEMTFFKWHKIACVPLKTVYY